MEIAFYGQSCIIIEIAGKSLLFDPSVRQNELAGNVDVPVVRAEVHALARRRLGLGANGCELAGRAGAPVTAAWPSRDF